MVSVKLYKRAEIGSRTNKSGFVDNQGSRIPIRVQEFSEINFQRHGVRLNMTILSNQWIKRSLVTVLPL